MKSMRVHLLVMIFLFISQAFAQDAGAPPPTKPNAGPARVNTVITVKRNDELNFDDELVEGMNRNPFDSLTHLEKKDERDQGHLYRKKASFKREISQTAQEMGYVQ